MPFPNFHAAALGIKLGFSVFFNCPMVNPPNLPLTAELATAIHEHANVQASFLPPVILGDILGDSKMVEVLSSIEYVCYGKCSVLGRSFKPTLGKLSFSTFRRLSTCRSCCFGTPRRITSYQLPRIN